MIRDEERHVDSIPEARTMTAREALERAAAEASNEVDRLHTLKDVAQMTGDEFEALWAGEFERCLSALGFAVLPAIPMPR